jgi:hypothetical protein
MKSLNRRQNKGKPKHVETKVFSKPIKTDMQQAAALRSFHFPSSALRLSDMTRQVQAYQHSHLARLNSLSALNPCT